MWTNFFDDILVINLLKREDRLLQTTKDFEEYGIPFRRVQAIEDAEQGARGLRDTMLGIFKEAIEKNHKHILVFEDDCKIIVEKLWLDDTMNKVTDQLPDNYHICYLGGQMSRKPTHFHSPNLLPVVQYFATHSVIYSLQGMKEIMSREMGYPIDNWMVEEIQKLGHTYACHPLLCSQYAGFSDIGHNFINWEPFIVPRHAQKIAEMHVRR